MSLPPQVQKLVDAIESLPGVAACFCGPQPLMEVKPEHLSLPGEFGDLPQVAIHRTNGGLEDEVLVRTEVILDRRVPDAWLTLEFLAWQVRDYARSGYQIQMRPMGLPPKAYGIQLGNTLKFFIECFIIEPGESYDKTLEFAEELGESIADSYEQYQECFENPADFTGDVESTE